MFDTIMLCAFIVVVFMIGWLWGRADAPCLSCVARAQKKAEAEERRQAKLKAAREAEERGEPPPLIEPEDEVEYDPDNEMQRADWWKHGRRSPPDWGDE